MDVVSMCARCDQPNERRTGSLFCSKRCQEIGHRIASRCYSNTGQRYNASSVGEWRAFYRRYAFKGELAPYGIDS